MNEKLSDVASLLIFFMAMMLALPVCAWPCYNEPWNPSWDAAGRVNFINSTPNYGNALVSYVKDGRTYGEKWKCALPGKGTNTAVHWPKGATQAWVTFDVDEYECKVSLAGKKPSPSTDEGFVFEAFRSGGRIRFKWDGKIISQCP